MGGKVSLKIYDVSCDDHNEFHDEYKQQYRQKMFTKHILVL